MKKSFLFCAVAGLLAFGSFAEAEVLIDFNDSSAVDLFMQNGGNAFGYSPTAGFGGTGGVTASNVGSAAVWTYKNSFEGNTSLTLAIDFQWTQPTFGVGQGFFVGLASSATEIPSASGVPSTGESQIYFGIGRVDGSNTARIIGRSIGMVEGALTGQNFQGGTNQNVTLTSGAWYNISGDITYSDVTQKYTIAITLSSLNGEGNRTTISSYTMVTSQDMSALANGTLYAYFGSDANVASRGTVAADNFYISAASIPEPASAAFLGFGGALLCGGAMARRLARQRA